MSLPTSTIAKCAFHPRRGRHRLPVECGLVVRRRSPTPVFDWLGGPCRGVSTSCLPGDPNPEPFGSQSASQGRLVALAPLCPGEVIKGLEIEDTNREEAPVPLPFSVTARNAVEFTAPQPADGQALVLTLLTNRSPRLIDFPPSATAPSSGSGVVEVNGKERPTVEWLASTGTCSRS